MRRPLYDAASHCFSIALFLGQGLAVQTAPKALAIRHETLESFLRPAPWHQLLVAPSHPAKVVEDLNSIYRDGLQIQHSMQLWRNLGVIGSTMWIPGLLYLESSCQLLRKAWNYPDGTTAP